MLRKVQIEILKIRIFEWLIINSPSNSILKFKMYKNSKDTNRKVPDLLSLDMSNNDITDEDLKNFSFQSIKNKDLTIKRTISGNENFDHEHEVGNDRYHRRLWSRDFELDSPVGYSTVERFILPQDDVSDIEPVRNNENTKEQTLPTKNVNSTVENNQDKRYSTFDYISINKDLKPYK